MENEPDFLKELVKNIASKVNELRGENKEYDLLLEPSEDESLFLGATSSYFNSNKKSQITLHYNPKMMDDIREHGLNEITVLDEAIHIAHQTYWEDIAKKDSDLKDFFKYYKEDWVPKLEKNNNVELRQNIFNFDMFLRNMHSNYKGDLNPEEQEEKKSIEKALKKLSRVHNFTIAVEHSILMEKYRDILNNHPKYSALSKKEKEELDSVLNSLPEKDFHKLVKERKTSSVFLNKVIEKLKSKGFNKNECNEVASILQQKFIRTNKRMNQKRREVFPDPLGNKRVELEWSAFGEKEAVKRFIAKPSKKGYLDLHKKMMEKHPEL